MKAGYAFQCDACDKIGLSEGPPSTIDSSGLPIGWYIIQRSDASARRESFQCVCSPECAIKIINSMKEQSK